MALISTAAKLPSAFAVLLLIAVGSAAGQALPGSIEIGGGGGRFYGGSFAKGTTRATAGTIDIATIELLALRSFPYGHFVPYVALGGGITNLNINVPDRNVRDVNRFGMAAALGAKLYATRWLGFRIDARGRATYLGKRRVEDGDWTDTNRWMRNTEILGGVFLAFGMK